MISSPTNNALLATVREFAAHHSTVSLATRDGAGSLHAANLYVAVDEQFNLYFLSAPHVRHVLDVGACPDVAGTWYAAVDSPREIHGIQFHGRCVVREDASRAEDWARYGRRFPWANDYATVAADARFFRIEPSWLRWIDNRRGFGFTVESVWPPGDPH
ncbi:MAG: hypothetical protein B7733_25880 [Myxococcales bacterium FL481]|nr:MAG: hypothetical protein B7733_25880 [Myxococcales bacterium FL481]